MNRKRKRLDEKNREEWGEGKERGGSEARMPRWIQKGGGGRNELCARQYAIIAREAKFGVDCLVRCC